MHDRTNHRTQTRSSNLSTLARLSALMVAWLALGGCDLVERIEQMRRDGGSADADVSPTPDGSAGDGDAADTLALDADGSESETICTPKYPERPEDCTVKERQTLEDPEDFETLCNSKCSRFDSIEAKLIADRKLSRLETLPPLRGIERVESYLQIVGYTDLRNLDFLSDLRVVGTFQLNRDDSLTDLSGLSSLKTVSGELEIQNAEAVRSLEGADALREVTVLRLRDNPKLESLKELRDVTFEPSDFGPRELIVRDNDSLENLDGLQGATVLDGRLTIQGNDNLESLKGLENLQRVEKTVFISNNPNLPSCEAKNLVDRIETESVVTVKDNDDSATCK